jgi:SAM-dependent methyltransferase
VGRLEELLARERRLIEARADCRRAADAAEALRNDVSAVTSSAAAIRTGLAQDEPDASPFGDFTRLRPFSALWGADRGQCIDRYYIEAFLAAAARDIRGVVLEVHDNGYTRAFGGTAVVRSDVLDINPGNRDATVVADLQQASQVASGTYDCLVITQTLHLIPDIAAAVRECHRILKPDGVLLATLPCASRLAPEQGPGGDFWRLTKRGVERLCSGPFDADRVEVQAHGNLTTSIAFLYGLGSDDLHADDWPPADPMVPLVITVRARRGRGPGA